MIIYVFIWDNLFYKLKKIRCDKNLESNRGFVHKKKKEKKKEGVNIRGFIRNSHKLLIHLKIQVKIIPLKNI